MLFISTYNLLLSFFLGREEGMMQWGDLREKFKEKKWKRNFFTYLPGEVLLDCTCKK
jgi:hypothetical protein